ncbi:HAD-IIIC family phosphatase [[Clostridium] polysaccharolyticum]|uniref:HAD-superfamily phosphatase, subfamily IIIC/FkbH-like domain-containing protein n=1 Tax=[Clostridium] polysaccharolyticum TaxID=29364 RepID=A0A1I0E4J7_9FIRM|nr:HAD-IIIC family phosphatase [[Clostridium] polysaccharolyticum]SET39803.1 HAD-superfamily phosphatase, subfamily IIIC/FkbH-like domain-containing protein [[Clostridium] polysaccharolyticum]
MESRSIKCVVWDLDNTIWDGILLEDHNVTLKEKMVETIKELDRRGILNAIASRNFYEEAWEKLQQFKIAHYFVCAEISMEGAKSQSVANISKQLNLALDAFAFIDDQDFEIEEVKTGCPEVLCLKADNQLSILDKKEFIPRFVTEDSAMRRVYYQNDVKRQEYEKGFKRNVEFLQSLNMKMIIKEAEEEDLKRVEELTIRTHQLNSTGITYDYNELISFIQDENYLLLVSEMEDKFGAYGKIGVTLIEKGEQSWHIKLHLMSCRVMSRGVGNAVLCNIIEYTKKNNLKLYADFKKTSRNKNMYFAYKLLGFTEAQEKDDYVKFYFESKETPQIPAFVEIESDL